MRRLVPRYATVVALAFGSPLAAQTASPQLLVSVDWLAQHINDTNVVLLHVGEKPEYEAGHIPGAHFVTMADVSAPRSADTHTPGMRSLELPDPATLRARLESLGISDDSHIIVYYGKDWVSPSTRVIFALDYIGLGARTSLLNGGMPAWTRGGHSLATAVPTPRPGRLSQRPTRDLVVDAEFVQGVPQRTGFALVDARAPAFYDGTSTSQNDRKGHIPGARSIPFTTLGDDQLMVDVAALERVFRDAGVRRGDTIVGYCHIGQQATAMLFGARLLGHDVRLYDGSMEDWTTRDLPVTTSKQ